MWPAFLDGVSIRCQSSAAANFLVKLSTFNAFHATRDISFSGNGAKSRSAYGALFPHRNYTFGGVGRSSMNPDLSIWIIKVRNSIKNSISLEREKRDWRINEFHKYILFIFGIHSLLKKKEKKTDNYYNQYLSRNGSGNGDVFGIFYLYEEFNDISPPYCLLMNVA